MTTSKGHTGYRYTVYGVAVTSDMAFEFPVARDTDTPLAEVEFLVRAERGFPIPARDPDSGAKTWFECRVLPDGSTYVRWSDLYAFLIEPDGLRVSCRQLARGNPGILQNFLFGQALSFALVRQGLEQLHAAVLGVEDVAIGFLGDCTFGKSTLAASFVGAGHRLLTDDLLMIDRRTRGPFAVPGSGRIKLEPDSALALLTDTTRGDLLNPDSSKRSFPLTEDCVQRTGLPLTHLFVLSSPDERDGVTEVEIRPLSRTAMLQELLKSSFNTQMFDRPRLERQFEFVAEVASDVEGFALRYPRGLHHLREVREAVVDHVHRTVDNPTLQERQGGFL
jgi:hypothetical protein